MQKFMNKTDSDKRTRKQLMHSETIVQICLFFKVEASGHKIYGGCVEIAVVIEGDVFRV